PSLIGYRSRSRPDRMRAESRRLHTSRQSNNRDEPGAGRAALRAPPEPRPWVARLARCRMRSAMLHATMVVAVAAALVPGAALADGNPPPGTPSIGQYVETLPTAQGGAPAGAGN